MPHELGAFDLRRITPVQGSKQIRDPAFSDRCVADSRALLATVQA